MNLIARLTVTALVAPAALVVLTGTASAETPASQPGVTIGQPIGPVKPAPPTAPRSGPTPRPSTPSTG